MLELNYTLHTIDGHILDQTVRAEQPPRVGDMIGFDESHSFLVIDVLWHLNHGLPGSLGKVAGTTQPRITITACELDWHWHLSSVLAEWRRLNEAAPGASPQTGWPI